MFYRLPICPFAHFHIILQILPAIKREKSSYLSSIISLFMLKIVAAAFALILLIAFNACKKSDSNNNNSSAKTVANLSGSYGITAISANVLGASVNLYDSLPPCDQDNLIQLNTNLTVQFIDAGVMCVPPSDSTGTWSLSSGADTIYVAGGASYIKSFDGKTLVLTNQENISGFPVTATTTLSKK
jgi:hypothetical protein